MAEPPGKFQKYFSIAKLCYQIAMIVLATYSLIMAVLAYSNLEATHSAMKDFVTNWEMQPILDLKVSTIACPDGYESLIDRKWPGTNSGCDCRNVYEYRYRLYYGSCDSNQTDEGCRDVYPKSSMSLGRFYGNLLCAKRGGDTFEDARRPNKDGVCDEGYFPSHSGDTDKIVCIENGQPVPINDIKIIDPNESPPAGYESLILNNNFKIAFTTESNSLPIIRFRLTEQEVCADKRQFSTTNGRSLYLLLDTSNYGSCSRKIGGYTTDPRYEDIGIVLEKNLFDDNGVMSVVSNLPDYPTESALEYYWKLFQNPYYAWNLDCEQSKGYTRSHMMSLIDDAMAVGGKQLKLMLICIFNSLVCSLILGGISIYIAYNQIKDHYFKEESAMAILAYTVCSNIIKWTFYGLKVLFYIQVLNIIDQYKDSIELMNDAKCSDEIANNYMDAYSTTLLDSRNKNRQGFISCIFSICLSAIMLILSVMMWGIKKVRSRGNGGYDRM